MVCWSQKRSVRTFHCFLFFFKKDRLQGLLQLPSTCRGFPSNRRRIPFKRRAELDGHQFFFFWLLLGTVLV